MDVARSLHGPVICSSASSAQFVKVYSPASSPPSYKWRNDAITVLHVSSDASRIWEIRAEVSGSGAGSRPKAL
jgi:hypothetical protein